MYLFLPVINKGLEIINKSQLKITFISFIFFFVILNNYISNKNDIFLKNGGFSVMWFLYNYIIGAYFGKFKNNENISRIKKYIYCLIYIFIFCFATYLASKYKDYAINSNNSSLINKIKLIIKLLFIANNTSILPILQSISIVKFFTSIKYNKYIAKIFTVFGPLVFSIYLIHCHPIILNDVFIKHFKVKYSSYLPLNDVLKIIFLRAAQIFIICILIDYLRNILFKIFQIRKMCILIEKLIFKILG